MTSPENQLSDFLADVGRLREAVSSQVVGQRALFDGVLTCLLAGGHALIEGVPGVGKTLMVRTVADALSLRFARIQFTPDLMPSDLVGTSVLREDGTRRFEFAPGPVFAQLVLADEINRATPKTQSALLEVMQEHTVSVAGVTHTLAEPYCVLATQNPLEMEGTYPLPEAQLDRFLLQLQVPFPSREELHQILDRTAHGEPPPKPGPVLSPERVLALRGVVRQIAVPHSVQDYALRVLEATHPERARELPRITRFVRYGASPRGAQALLLAGKVRAALAGRFAIGEQDVRAVAQAALRHRLILNFEGEAEGITPEALLDDVLGTVR
ncbi:MAG TPA: MoxR family ATPase [Polyangiales bacterium]|nr:MoxR family ATPase [Polyangiales bacterium]